MPDTDKPPHIAIDVNKDPPDEPPPPFTTYVAEYFETSGGDIVSHDHHLNEDGEALYRFILTHSEKPPSYLVQLRGTHPETRTRRVSRTINGQTQWHTETYTVTVTDFDFSIDLAVYIALGPQNYSLPDDAATYRGLMVKQVMTPKGIKRKATPEEKDQFKADEWAHEDAGLPLWKDMDGSTRWESKEASSLTLRQWADQYALSKKILKEFTYEKKVYGWSTHKLRDAITMAIHQTGYSSSISISFHLSSTKICIRPDNRLSRTLSRTLYKVLLIIFLVYPFIWLFKRFSRYGGGKWEVYGGMYALNSSEPITSDEDISGLLQGEDARRPTMLPRLVVDDETGIARKIVGYREGEWFREWEPVIKRSVGLRLQRDEPFRHVDQAPADPTTVLDG